MSLVDEFFKGIKFEVVEDGDSPIYSAGVALFQMTKIPRVAIDRSDDPKELAAYYKGRMVAALVYRAIELGKELGAANPAELNDKTREAVEAN